MTSIFIPSHNRSGLQNTLLNFNDELRSKSILVVQQSQLELYEPIADKFNIKDIVVLPENIKTLSPTYEYIIRNNKDDKFFICDDDLMFAHREYYYLGDTKLTRCNGGEELTKMFNTLCDKLDKYVHVGISARSGNNRVDSDENGTWRELTRMMQFTGYQKEPLEWVETNRVKCRDDFDRHLQLIEAGYKNIVTYDYTIDQCGSNTSGGCSGYRDKQMLHDEAHALAKLHPVGVVNVVQKKTKADWGVGGVRTDVIIQWKKAYRSGGHDADI